MEPMLFRRNAGPERLEWSGRKAGESDIVRWLNRADAWRDGVLTRLRGSRLKRKCRRCEAGAVRGAKRPVQSEERSDELFHA
jgi:hypothetical protein